jgi:PPOX class probable F420-dependent enzyme
MELTDAAREMLHDPRVFAFLGTVYRDGRAHVNPMWIDAEGDSPTFNSARGRVKVGHLERDPRVTVTLVSLDDPYTYLELHGTVEAVTGQAAEDHIHRLARKYLGAEADGWESSPGLRVKYVMDVSAIAGG